MCVQRVLGSLVTMKAFFSGVFWVSLALAVAFWGLFVVDLTSYAKMGNIHELVGHSIEVAGSQEEVFAKVTGLKVERGPSDSDQDAEAAQTDESTDVRVSFDGESMLELPGLQKYGSASLLVVEHRLPDFLLYQERYQKIVFLHGLGFEEVTPGVTEITWQVQSPNTQWWFHGFILYPATYLWSQQVTQALKKVKEKLDKG